METHIIIAPVNSFERKQLENIENQKFDSEQAVRDELGDKDNNLIIHTLTDFMDECNDEMVMLTEEWLGYVQIKK